MRITHPNKSVIETITDKINDKLRISKYQI